MAKALMILALLGLAASAMASTVEFDAMMQSEEGLIAATNTEMNAAALAGESAFFQVVAVAEHIARLTVEERAIADKVVNQLHGNIGALKVGDLTRADQSELIPMAMAYNRDLNVKLASLAHAQSGSSDEAFSSFIEADSEAEAEAGMFSEASLEALLATMDEATMEHFIAAKETVLQAAISSTLDGSDIAEAAQWPDFIDNAAKWVGDKASDVGNAVSSAAGQVKDAAVSAYETVKNTDIHDLSGKVGEIAGKVKDVSGKIAEYSGPIAAMTAGIPYVGAATKAIDTAANVVNTGAGIVETGANLIHDNTKEGETVGEALGRAKDAVKSGIDKAVDYAKNPGKLVDDVKNAAKDCIANPSACVDKAADVASTAAKLLGKEDIADKIDSARDLAKQGLDALGIKDKNDTEKKDGEEKKDAPAGGDKKDEKAGGGDKKDGQGKEDAGGDRAGDRGARGGDRGGRGGDRGDRGGRRGDRRGDRGDRGGR